MINKKENEQVVNRFLYSTLYAILIGFYIYLTYVISVSPSYFSMYYKILEITVGILGCATIAAGVLSLGFKKVSLYQFVASVFAFVIVVFLRYSILLGIAFPTVSNYLSGPRNIHRAAALVLLVIYIYEFIRYMIKNR